MTEKNGQGVSQNSMKVNIQRFAGVLCLLSIAVFFSTCAVSIANVEYTFNNQSSYRISVTLNKSYKTKVTNGEKTEYVENESKTLTVSAGSKSTVYVDSENTDFSWTSDYASNNKNIYCVVDKNKATFMDR